MKKFSFLILIVILYASCSPEKEVKSFEGIVKTIRYENVTDKSADCIGCVWITPNNESSIDSSGICYTNIQTLQPLEKWKREPYESYANGEYSVRIQGLNSNTAYYFRAYSVINEKTVYGDPISFKTYGTIIALDSTIVVLNQDLGEATFWSAISMVKLFDLEKFNEWDLPTVPQLDTLFKNKQLGEYFSNGKYWSKNCYYDDSLKKYFPLAVNFPNYKIDTIKNGREECKVRPIHSITKK